MDFIRILLAIGWPRPAETVAEMILMATLGNVGSERHFTCKSCLKKIGTQLFEIICICSDRRVLRWTYLRLILEALVPPEIQAN